ncbi:NACHT and WD repeat domain-containing protein 2-like [Watersipora subatra]|uniref:NACHT and WD repeat domain-containing protein 2-like n=1 Tax=Watersipora subatra TaxID=2589382 RepID=UPI00355C61D8
MYCMKNSGGEYKSREFRLKELIRAQRLSAGPAFLALLGQKYGYRPTPQLILSEIFELIQTALLKSNGRRSRNAHLLDKWYKQDENSIPAVHILQGDTASDLSTWKSERDLLQNVLMFGVELCCKEGSLPPEALKTYFASELENEVKHGLMNGKDDTALVIQRTISDLSNYTSGEQASSFTELEWNEIEEKWQQCEGSRQLLDNLKETVVTRLSDECISNYAVLWRFDSGVHQEFHKDYIDQLCENLTEKLRSQIAQAAATNSARRETRTRLHNEVIAHWRKATERGQDCQGRENELQTLTNYLKSKNSEFFTIYGESGSGKTCVMAKLLIEMDSALPVSTITVARFLGLTQECSDLRDLLSSICEQVLACLDKDTSIIPVDFTDVLKFFSNLLHEIPPSIKLILLLDSLNSLLPDYNAHLLQWLPSVLPSNVKIIVSCQPHAHGMFTRIKTELISQNHDNFIEMIPLGQDKAMLFTLHWLQQENMCVTNSQAEVLKGAFKQCSLPLYVKLVFERVKQWRSFDEVDEDVLGTSCEGYLENFFTELEKEHGPSLVKHAMSYLTASKTGVSDMEMEDLLSLNEEVMEEVFQNQEPVVRRCPPGIWAKLRNDIDPLIKLKAADDHDVYYWMHAIIKTYVEKRYLNCLEHLKATHHTIADFYLGTWHSKPKKYISSSGKEAAMDRKVLSQPLTYTNALGETHYNKRKYDQVPRQLYLANRLDELNAKVMFNYDWLYNKIKALSLQKILADLNLNPGVEATLLEGALRSAQGIVLQNINNMPVELSGRLLPYYHTHSNIRALIDQCDTTGLSHCSLVPMFNYHHVPGSPLQYTFDCVDVVDSLLVTHDERHVLVKSDNSQRIRKFDLLTGETQGDIITSYGRAYLSPDSQHLVIVDNEIEKAIKVHDAISGAFLFQLIPSSHLDAKEQRKYQLGAIALSSDYIAVLVNTETTHMCVASYEQKDFQNVVDLEGKGATISIAPNQKYLLCNVRFTIFAYNMEHMDQVCSTQLEHKMTQLVISPSSNKAFVTDQASHIITVLHLTSDGCTEMVSKIPLQMYLKGNCVNALTLSHDEQMLMVRGEDRIVVYNCQTDQVTVDIRRSENVMKEFRLPKHSKPTEIVYTDAIFSHDDTTIMAGLFRNIQFWDSKTGLPTPTNILAPVGIITQVRQSSFQGQIITVQQDAKSIQVWNLTDYIMDVTSLDRLTSPVDKLILSEDNKTCFAIGAASDEIGVIDMHTGLLTNLLTHESNVKNVTPVSDGSYLFVALDPSKAEHCNKIWSVANRQIIKQFGRSIGLTTSLKNSNTIIHISQVSSDYQAPYSITMFNFSQGMCNETSYDFIINYAISQPLVTADDTYMVLLTADQYIERQAKYRNPSICAFYLKGRYMHSVIGKEELSPFLDTRHIITLVPITHNSTEIIVIYQPVEGNGTYGFACVDLAMGTVLRYSDNFMPPQTNLKSFYLTNDGFRCINSDLGMVFAMNTGQCLATINNKGSQLALLKGGEAVAYYQGAHLIVERLRDNQIFGKCDVHVDICHVMASNDDRTILVGCVDGTVLGFTLVDPETDNVQQIVTTIASRQGALSPCKDKDNRRPSTASTWDHADADHLSANDYSRITKRSKTSRDKEALRNIRPVYRSITAAKTTLRGGNDPRRISTGDERSRACSIM